MLVRGWFRSKDKENKYMLMARRQNSGQNHNIKTANTSLKV
jgi:hypothetical protein